MGLCKNCKFPMQVRTSMICAVTKEYIYPPADWGCNDSYAEKELPFREQMEATAKEKGFEFDKIEKSEFHGHEFEIHYYKQK